MKFYVDRFKISLLLPTLILLMSCTPYPEKLIVGAAPWPNFEFTFLAEQLGYIDPNEYSLVELTSSTSVIQAFQSNKLDVAFVSLDEVLTLAALGVDLKIISVVDVSFGGDALMTKPEIKSLDELKWRTIGYENKAAGALLLDKFFSLTGLNNQTVQLFEIKQNELKNAYLRGNIDALIVREPVKQQLLALGARELINSKALIAPITHVIIAREDSYETQQDKITIFLKQFYKAHHFYQTNPDNALTIMSVRLQLYPYLLENAFENMRFFTAKESLLQLTGTPSNIEEQAHQLSALMVDKYMLGQVNIDLSSLISSKILEKVVYD